MSPLAQLWAQGMGIDEWIKLIIIILFVIVPVILKFLGNLAAPQKPPAGQRPAPPPAAPRGAPRAPAGKPNVEDEIDQFLRRAATRQQTAAPPPPPPSPPVRPASRPALAEPLRDAPVEAQVVGDRPARARSSRARPTGRSSRSSLERDTGAPQASDSLPSRLGRNVLQADRQFDQRMEQVFQRDISALDTGPDVMLSPQRVDFTSAEEQAPSASSLAARMSSLLSSPEGLRQAILVNEILQRPEHRWQR